MTRVEPINSEIQIKSTQNRTHGTKEEEELEYGSYDGF